MIGRYLYQPEYEAGLLPINTNKGIYAGTKTAAITDRPVAIKNWGI